MSQAIRDLLVDTLVGSGRVVVSEVFLDHATELFELQDEQVVQAFSAQATDETLAKGICLRGSRGCFEDFNATGCRGKVRSELAIPIANQVFWFLIPGSGFT